MHDEWRRAQRQNESHTRTSDSAAESSKSTSCSIAFCISCACVRACVCVCVRGSVRVRAWKCASRKPTRQTFFSPVCQMRRNMSTFCMRVPITCMIDEWPAATRHPPYQPGVATRSADTDKPDKPDKPDRRAERRAASTRPPPPPHTHT